MNILVFSWRDPSHPLAGGAEQVDHEHHKGWIKAGHKITLLTSSFEGAKSEEVIDGIRILRRGNQFLVVHLMAFLWYLFGHHPKFDLVIDEFHGIPFFTPLYVAVKKLAILQEVAKEVWFKNHLPFPLNWIIGAIGFISEPLIFLLYKEVPFMVGSHSAKEDLIKMGIPEKNVYVVHHGVLIKRPKGNIKKEIRKTIIFLGALAKDKGIEDALKAFSYLDRKDNFQFWVAGRGGQPYLDFLIKMAKDLGLERKIKFWGFVSEEKKFELLSRSHVLVNPSVREGWGLVNIEANAFGTPVVAYRSPGLVDSVRNGVSGIICERNTPELLAKEIIDLLNDKDNYRKLQKGAISWSRKFSWRSSRRKSLDLVNSLGD